MRRYNRRLFRAVRSIVANDLEAEDIVQDAYVRAYQHLHQFEGRAQFSTWLTKIAIYEAYARVRRVDYQKVDSISVLEGHGMDVKANERDPEQQIYNTELNVVLEKAFDALPDDYRSVFMLREVEGLSTAETAECLELSEENVKTRLHRARALLQRELYSLVGANANMAFQFLGRVATESLPAFSNKSCIDYRSKRFSVCPFCETSRSEPEDDAGVLLKRMNCVEYPRES
jgi:RNA polymerase sigma-70 factor (ECF subfamily)